MRIRLHLRGVKTKDLKARWMIRMYDARAVFRHPIGIALSEILTLWTAVSEAIFFEDVKDYLRTCVHNISSK